MPIATPQNNAPADLTVDDLQKNTGPLTPESFLQGFEGILKHNLSASNPQEAQTVGLADQALDWVQKWLASHDTWAKHTTSVAVTPIEAASALHFLSVGWRQHALMLNPVVNSYMDPIVSTILNRRYILDISNYASNPNEGFHNHILRQSYEVFPPLALLIRGQIAERQVSTIMMNLTGVY